MHAPARNRQDKSETTQRFFHFWSSIFGFEMVLCRCALSRVREGNFCRFEALSGIVFAVFVGQKIAETLVFYTLLCTLPRLDGFARNF